MAGMPLKNTVLSEATELKFLPVTVTTVPTGPLVGENPVTVGSLVSTMKSVAGIAVQNKSLYIVVSINFPVFAPPGTITTSWVVEDDVKVAGNPLKVTEFSDAMELKFLPVIVTVAPITPLAGEKPVMEGSLDSTMKSAADRAV